MPDDSNIIQEPSWSDTTEFTQGSFAALQYAIDSIGTGPGNETVIAIKYTVMQDGDEELHIKSGQTIKLVSNNGVQFIDAKYKSRVIDIAQNATLFLENIRLAYGVADYGAGIYNEGTLVLLDESYIYTSEASVSGGGVYNGEGAILSLQGGVIGLNTAEEDGGGAYISDGSKFYGNSGSMSRNEAGKDGGAIYVSTENLGNVTTEPGFVFSGNRAQYGVYLGIPADIEYHDCHVLSTEFTEPFDYAYNNFDISFFYSPLVVSALKTANGGDLDDGTFSFVIKDDSGKTLATAANTSDGEIEFTPFTLTPGPHTFFMSETSASDCGWEMDDTVHTITFTLEAGDDGIVSPELSDDSWVFVNTYTPCVSVQIHAQKFAFNGQLEAGQFSFGLFKVADDEDNEDDDEDDDEDD